jgi:hypothetical protein
MPGLVPGIHAFLRTARKQTWMAGTSQDKPGHDGFVASVRGDQDMALDGSN